MTLAEELKEKGGFFYIKPPYAKKDGTVDVCVHIKGDTVDKVIENVRDSAGLRTMEFYNSKYIEKVCKDRVADFCATIEEIEIEKRALVEKLRAIPSMDELRNRPLKGEDGLLALCKGVGMENYSKLNKEELIKAFIAKVSEL